MLGHYRFRKRFVIGLLACQLLFALTAKAEGQVALSDPNAPGCRALDLDSDFQLINGPGSFFTVVFSMRNISGHPCVLDRGSYEASGSPTVPDSLDGKLFGASSDSVERVWGKEPIKFGTLTNGKMAYFTMAWKTSSVDKTPCLQPVAVGWSVRIVAPALLKPVCSEIEVSPFVIGSFRNRSFGKSRARKDAQMLALSAERNSYYDDERFFLHVALQNPASPLSPEEVCPTLYLRERSPDGGVDVRTKFPIQAGGCNWPSIPGHPGPPLANWRSGFDLNPDFSDTLVGLRRLEDHSFQVFETIAVPNNGPVKFASSNLLHIQFLNSSTASRAWGPVTEGLAVSVTLDKDIFEVGEDVPLHLAVENFSSDRPVGGTNMLGSSCGSDSILRVEVYDSNGNILQPNQRTHMATAYACEGFWRIEASPYQRGKVVSFEQTLGEEGWLPKQPGRYSIVVTLTPLLLKDASGIAVTRRVPSDYGTVQSRATLQIGDGKNLLPQ